MSKKELRSLIILVLVILFGVFRCVTAKYDYKSSMYLNYTPDKQGKNLKTEIYVISHKKNVEEITEEAFNLMQEMIYKFSDEYPESLVNKINNSKGQQVPMDNDLYELLQTSEEMYKLSNGKFDITVKPLYDLWDFDLVEDPTAGDNVAFIPDSLAIEKALELVDFSKITYNEKFIQVPQGMKITFGAISKGFIVDKIVDFLEDNGAIAGYVDQTSSIRYFGELDKQIILGVQHPRNSSEIIAELTNLADKSISTSGDYQQFFDVGNKRYHHLIDATSGYPFNGNVAITIIANTAFQADAYSTALFFLDSAEAVNLLKPKEETEAIIIKEVFNEKTNQFDAEFIKTEKTDSSKGLDYYLLKEDLD